MTTNQLVLNLKKTPALFGVVAAKRDLANVPGMSIKVDACNKDVHAIENSGHCNSMMHAQNNFQCVRKNL